MLTWADFDISNAGTYLGACIGPAGAIKLWTNAANKWASRAYTIGSSALPLQVSVTLCNARAIIALGYIAQIVLPPEKLF